MESRTLIRTQLNKIPDHEKQEAFTRDELKMLFCKSPEYADDRTPEAHHFWIPLIALFTGARREEICQLYVSDLKKEKGICCLAIQEEVDKPDKSVKTSEKRLVPLHPFIVENFKFVGYVNNLKDQRGRIFPKLKRTESGHKYGGAFGQWFSRFSMPVCIDIQPNVPLIVYQL
jgi:integrase